MSASAAGALLDGMFRQALQETLAASSDCKSNLYCETKAKPVALRVLANAYRMVHVTSLLTTRHPEPVLGILLAKLRLHAVAGMLRLIGTGEPLGVLLLGGVVDAWRLSCGPMRLASILAWLAKLWALGPAGGLSDGGAELRRGPLEPGEGRRLGAETWQRPKTGRSSRLTRSMITRRWSTPGDCASRPTTLISLPWSRLWRLLDVAAP